MFKIDCRKGGGAPVFTLFLDDDPPAPAAAAQPVPWAVSFGAGGAYFANCCYKRGPVFVWVADSIGPVALSVEDGATVFVSARINLDTGEVSVVSGTDSEVTSQSVPGDEYYYLPLYVMRYDAGSASHSVALKFNSIDVVITGAY